MQFLRHLIPHKESKKQKWQIKFLNGHLESISFNRYKITYCTYWLNNWLSLAKRDKVCDQPRANKSIAVKLKILGTPSSTPFLPKKNTKKQCTISRSTVNTWKSILNDIVSKSNSNLLIVALRQRGIFRSQWLC